MPLFDGTGPRGLGPMTGRGEGYCSMVLPSPDAGRAPYGYAGLAGRPVQVSPQSPPAGTVSSGLIAPPLARRWPTLRGFRLGRGFGWRRGRGGRRR
jgi:hypothetical protein